MVALLVVVTETTMKPEAHNEAYELDTHSTTTLASEVKKLGRPATAPNLVDWNRETAGISADIEGVETQAYSAAGLDARFSACWRRCESSPADTSCTDAA
jgi:hypothetical protein